jgi:hypothetical protein
VCTDFGRSAQWLLSTFMDDYPGIGSVNLSTAGIADVYGVSLVIGSAVAGLLILGQVMRTLWTRDGSGLAQALAGTARAILAWLATVAVATAAIAAADSITQYIASASHNAQQSLGTKIGTLLSLIQAGHVDPSHSAVAGVSILLVFALLAILLVIVLWVELLLRNAALAVVIAVSPIAAAGQVSEATKTWWTRAVSASVQLIILKPIIALVFMVGTSMVGTSSGVSALLQGLLVLGLAAFAWPVIARWFTFASIQSTGSGIAALLGFAAGSMSGGGGQAAGVRPGAFGQSAGSRVPAEGGEAGGEMPAAATGAGGGAAPGGGNGGAVAAGIGWAVASANRLGSFAAGRLEQTAGHAGMPGAYPYSTISGHEGAARPRHAGGAAAGGGQPAGAGAGGHRAREPELVPPEASDLLDDGGDGDD